MLSQLLMVFALQAATGPAPEFDISGAHIGMRYAVLRASFPEMTCEASCSDPSAELHGYTGNLWVGIGDGAVNQLAFRFEPTLSWKQAEDVRARYIELYGAPSRTTDQVACDAWDRGAGTIILCLTGGHSLTYWKDHRWGVTTSVIPSDI